MTKYDRMLSTIPAFKAFAGLPRHAKRVAKATGLSGLVPDMSAKFRFSKIPKTISENRMECRMECR